MTSPQEWMKVSLWEEMEVPKTKLARDIWLSGSAHSTSGHVHRNFPVSQSDGGSVVFLD
jgi:hypothetical protein